MGAPAYTKFNCYEILETHFNASPQEIRDAYKKASLKSHPDKGGSHEAQIKVNLAREILSDPLQRQDHDTYWRKLFSKNRASDHGFNNQQNHQHANSHDKETQTGASEKKSKANKSSSFNSPKQDPEALFSFKMRLQDEIEKRKAQIWLTLDALVNETQASIKNQIEKAKNNAVISSLAFIAFTALSIQYPGFWFVVAGLVINLGHKAKGIKIGNATFALFDADIDKKIMRQAQFVAAEACSQRASAVERYHSLFVTLKDVLQNSSSVGDRESAIARRFTIALFLMGYNPELYIQDDRMLIFNDGEQRILVRFRHRAGASVDISYVKKLYSMMNAYRVTLGFLFGSPGISGPAAAFAAARNIKVYTLETMNNWIEEVIMSGHTGPDGDLLENISKLNNFLQTIRTKDSGSSSYGPRRRRYY